MLAYAGIEAASDLAPDIEVEPRDLKRIVSLGAIAVPLVYAGMAAIALMAVPVVAGPHGPRNGARRPVHRGTRCSASSPPSTRTGVAEMMRWMVALIAAPVLFWAATTSMLGVSRHIYTLAINRQIPSWLGKLERNARDPLRGDRDLRADRARPRRSRPTSSSSPASTPSAPPWRSRSPTSRSSGCGSRCPTSRGPSASPGA